MKEHLRKMGTLVALALLMVGATRLHAQKIDANANGMSDVWEWLYGARALSPTGDADGDGVSNGQESIAGTDPFNPSSVPRISSMARSNATFTVSMSSALGKQYQLQSIQDLGLSNWTTEATLVARTGSVVTLSASASSAAKYFRISISDVDTDGDGVNDWEEYKLGLDPLNAFSNNQLGANGQPLNDYAYASSKLASQNVITISATDPAANQPDPAQSAINVGTFVVTRGGFPLTGINVNLSVGGPGAGLATEGVDFLGLAHTAILPAGASSKSMTVTPLANPNLLTPALATMTVLPGSGYTVGGASNASVVIYPTATPKGTGLTGQYYTNANASYANAANLNPANLKLTRVDAVVDYNWGNTNYFPITNSGYYSIRWSGQVQPQYSETYYFVANTDDGVKLWVNDKLIIDNWVTRSAADSTGSIDLLGGIRYNIRMEYFRAAGSGGQAHLSWYSPNQSKQIIPTSRLYPTNVPAAAAAVISPLTAIAFLGQPFSYTVIGANSGTNYTAKGLPPGLAFNAANGVISGIPTNAGDYQVTLTASNLAGFGASVVDIQVIDTGNAVTREVWTGVSGVNISDIPVNSPATVTNTLVTLEGIADYGDNYGERIRGYLTAPATANFYFLIAGSDAAELWISNDSEPANKVRRAFVSPNANPTPPPDNGTASRQWDLQPNQKSGWLSLVAGQRYYVEILHKAGIGTNDNFAVAWLQDPTGTNTVANGTGVVPGYVLSPYFTLPPSFIPGTLYSANLLAAPGATSAAIGSATLRVSGDGSQAVLNYKISNLSSAHVDHIKNDPFLTNAVSVLYDISDNTPQPDGSFIWKIQPTGTFSAADILEVLSEGKAYINIETGAFPDGEISGHFVQANGTPTFSPPAAPPTWPDDHSNSNAAALFLIQSTFGPCPDDITAVQSMGYTNWILNQFSLPASHHLPLVMAKVYVDPGNPYPAESTFNSWWQQSVSAPDQLRQRVAFALSEIMVVSENGVLSDNARALSDYYDTLLDYSFGNFRELLEAVTLTPTMGLYLDMRANDVGSMITGIHANENYAREVMQLFSIGLNRVWPDGTLITDSLGNLIPTYDQNVIMGFASVFTGWNYYQPLQSNGRLPTNFNASANYTLPMVLVPLHHELGTKRLLDNVVLPPAWGSQADPASANFDSYCLQDLESALDSIFKNQNVGPFVCRQLIQRLVTSNPSREYIYRVVQKFNDNGAGVHGDMQAVIQAILLDYEARSSAMTSQPGFGKQREPLLRATAIARAFPPALTGGSYSQSNGTTITITTTNAHRRMNNDVVSLNFIDTSGQPAPPGQGYSVTANGTNTFTVPAPGLLGGTYGQTNGTITATLSGHGLLAGNPVFMTFTTGGASSGLYNVVTVPDSSHLTLSTTDTGTNFGNCIIPRWVINGTGGFSQNKTNITITTPFPHGLIVGNNVYVNFTAGSPLPASGQYQVLTVPDANHFTILVVANATQTQNALTIYPLIAPPLVRSGTVNLEQGTWAMNSTDNNSATAGTAQLFQSPLRAPTVFNFFFPDYRFPGTLASAGLTTPEFQLTSDTSVALEMNFLEGAILSGSNTNGLGGFTTANGVIMVDLGRWMTPNYTSNAGLPGLVDALNTLLIGGRLNPSARTLIVNYASTFAYTVANPKFTEMRDRVRAVVHLLVNSADFTIQK